MKLVAFGYRTRTGKGTAAKYLCDKYGFVQVDLGDEIRRQCAACYHLPLSAFNEENKDKVSDRWKMTHRDILKKHSVAMTELWGVDFWVKYLDERIKDLWATNSDVKVVVSDLRRPHEVDYILACNGQAIRVDGPPRGAFIHRGHLTDYALEDYPRWSETIHNDATFVELYHQLDCLAIMYGWA